MYVVFLTYQKIGNSIRLLFYFNLA